MRRSGLRLIVFALIAFPAASGFAATVATQPGDNVTPLRRFAPFEAARMIIEYNATDGDIGVQAFLDGEGWTLMNIVDPHGVRIFSAQTQGSLFEQGGGSEMFLESVEPTLDDLSFADFFRRFPEGRYRFNGRDADGKHLGRSAQLTHTLPAGPVILVPAEISAEDCELNSFAGGAIVWEPVVADIHGMPLEVVGYELIIESEDDVNVLDIRVGGDVHQVTVPPEVLDEDADYEFEVLAIEEGGNQTITESCFHTSG